MKTKSKSRFAFTLIEVLVVVAIIALLIAILMPTLSRAKEQARIGVCKANMKQIGTILTSYQVSERGYSPVLLNWYARYPQYYPDGSQKEAPARVLWPSVALRNHDNAKFPRGYDPEQPWTQEKHDEYQVKVVSGWWVCPFVSGKGQRWSHYSKVRVRGPGPTQNYGVRRVNGRSESYESWLWEEVIRGERVRGDEELHPNDPFDGRPKYSALTWNRVRKDDYVEAIPNSVSVEDAKVNYLHRKWDLGDCRRRKANNLSDVTVLFCGQGYFLSFGHYMNNPESHRTSQGAGTNTLFADTHVEWVRGNNIGWP